ncbi:ATP-binding cassette domain-containing protein [Kitasatospora sp. NPDC051853]|uniref:ATP-binding cassette domain-containing protein n=1 Tax=Kitasatospora sp. NPDC051853 TaxID=3364058 RepID=UPI0037A5C922
MPSPRTSRPSPLRPVLLLGRRWTVALGLAVAASTACTLLLPGFLARAVDRTLAGEGTGAGAQLVFLVAVFALAESGAQYAAPRGAAAVTAALRASTVRHLVATGPGAASPRTAARPEAGDLAARLTGSAPLAGLAGAAVVYTAAQVVTAVGAVAGLCLLAPWPALAFLVAAPAGWWLVRRQVGRTARHGEAYQVAQAAITTRLVEALRGARNIRAAGAEGPELARVLGPLPELSRHGHGLWRSQRQTAWKVGLLAPATHVAVLAAAGAELAAGRLSPGGLAAAMAYATIGLGGFGAAQSLLDLARARSGAVRIAELCAVPAPVAGTRLLPAGAGRLEFHDVVLHPSLRSLDLTVPARSWVAVVGSDDGATSAVAALAAGLTAPDAGRVRLDGADLRTVRPDRLRSAVAVAFPDPVLYGATVAEALTLGHPSIGERELAQAARSAGADAFLRRLPSGYRTPTADAPLSGGERQRTGLARALCRPFRLLVLDGATASLDRATEGAVLDSLTLHATGRTRLCATRSATVAERADLVAWLEDGRVRAMAPHRELWRSPSYRALFTAELAQEAPAPAPEDAPPPRPGGGPAPAEAKLPVPASDDAAQSDPDPRPSGDPAPTEEDVPDPPSDDAARPGPEGTPAPEPDDTPAARTPAAPITVPGGRHP